MVSLRRGFLLSLDLATTVLTLLTGLRENPVLTYITGRYDHVRSRLAQRRINYNIIRDEHLNTSMLPDLQHVAQAYRFYAAPSRHPGNIGTNRSTCPNVNSMNASVLTLNYDDFFGKGARREQIYLHSISAPHCQVINFEPTWYETECVESRFAGNITACHEFILHNFDTLLETPTIHVGAPVDFGVPGIPFLKCLERPPQRFQYMTDLIVWQSYWAGGSYHFEVQSSRCWALPSVQTADAKWGLFQASAADASADVVFAVEPQSWVAFLIAVVYGVLSITMILRGIFLATSKDNRVKYVPSAVRYKLLGIFPLPFVSLTTRLLPTALSNRLLICRGIHQMASDMWMNHWLYITLSILDSMVSIRTTYIALEMGTWMLSNKRNIENFIFVCSAITKLTWLMCLVHTVFRFVVRLLVRVLATSAWLRDSGFCRFVAWYVDAVALFVNYAVYSLLLCIILVTIYLVRGVPTLMVHQPHYKQAVLGGFPDVANFWHNEIICDLVVLCTVQLLVAHIVGSLVLLTKYRGVTFNRVLRLMQDRFVFVGWDAFVAMEALGIDPDNPELLHDDVVMTNCSFGALLQQLYLSGPSGLVEFVGDAAFNRRWLVHSSDAGDDEDAAVESRYPLEVAQEMGLFRQDRKNTLSRIDVWRPTRVRSIVSIGDQALGGTRTDAVEQIELARTKRVGGMTKADGHARASRIVTERRKPFFKRKFHLHAEWRWGRLLLVDYEAAPGQVRKDPDTFVSEFVCTSAIEFLSSDDGKDLLTSTSQLQIC
ncbi:hypothetical protein ATCC90586_009341 [Pythium insidiosum]|nr:hypothetical protein ATCC90586_009341 [Pythium insidiosum]